MPLLLRQWEEYKSIHRGASPGRMRNIVLHQVVGGNIAVFVFLLTFAAVALLAPRGEAHKEFKHTVIPLTKYVPESQEVLVDTLYALVHAYLIVAWMQTVLTVISICLLFAREQKEITRSFADAAKVQSAPVRPRNMRRFYSQEALLNPIERWYNLRVEYFRQRHFSLSLLVAQFDDHIMWYLTLLYAFACPQIVLILFGVGGFSNLYQQSMVLVLQAFTEVIYFLCLIVWISYAGTCLATSVSVKSHVCCENLKMSR